MRILKRIILYIAAINMFITFCWISLIDVYLGKLYIEHEKGFMQKLSDEFENLKKDKK